MTDYARPALGFAWFRRPGNVGPTTVNVNHIVRWERTTPPLENAGYWLYLSDGNATIVLEDPAIILGLSGEPVPLDYTNGGNT